VIIQVANEHLPFGGVGQSGYGRYHAKAGFDAMSNVKSVLVKPVANYMPYLAMMPPLSIKAKTGVR